MQLYIYVKLFVYTNNHKKRLNTQNDRTRTKKRI